MNLFLCVDDDLGLSFGGKRQSRDSKLNEYMLAKAGGRLFIKPYSEILFPGGGATTVEDFSGLSCEDFCFLELDVKPADFSAADRLFICRWNRRYPSDVKFDFDFAGFKLTGTEDILGSSHEKITIEEYVRC